MADVQLTTSLKGYQEVKQGLGELDKQLKGLGQTATAASQGGWTTFGRTLDATGQKMVNTGKTASLYLTTPLVGIGAQILRVAGDFESSMNRLQASTGATGREFADLEAKARTLGATTQFSARDAADAMLNLAKNGLNTAEILGGATDQALELAAATGTSLANAADIASKAMQQFGFKADELGTVVQRMVGASNASTFSIDDFAMALGQAGGVASKVGVSFKDFSTSIATTSSAFFSGSDAGTSFKTFLLGLSPTTKSAAEEMKSLGLMTEQGGSKFFDATGKMKPMREVVALLETAFAGLSDEQKQNAASTIFGTDAMRTALTLAGGGVATWDKYEKAISDVDVAQQRMAREQGFNQAIKELQSALEELVLTLADAGFLQWATDFARGLTSLVQVVASSNPKLLQLATVAGLIGAAMGPVLLAFGNLVRIGGAVSSGVGLVATAFGTLGRAVPIAGTALSIIPRALAAIGTVASGPIGLAIAAVAGVVLAFKNWDLIKGYADKAWTAIKSFSGEAVKALGAMVTQGVDYVRRDWPKVYDAIASTGTALSRALSGLGASVKSGLGALVDVASALWRGDFPKVFEVASSIGTAIQTKIKGIASWVSSGVATLVDAAGDYWRAHFPTSFEVAASIATTIRSKISGFAQSVRDGVGALVDAGKALWAGDFPRVFEIASSIGTAIKGKIAAFASAVRDGVSALVTAGADYWRTQFPESFTVASSLAATIKSKIAGLASAVGQAIKDLVAGASHIWSGDLPGAFSVGQSVGQTIGRAIAGMLSWIASGIRELVSGAGREWGTGLPGVFAVAASIGTAVGRAILGLGSFIAGAIVGLVQGAAREWGIQLPSVFTVAASVGSAVTNALKGLGGAIAAGIDSLIVGAKNLWQGSIYGVFSVTGAAANIVRDQVAGIYTYLRDGLLSVFTKLKADVTALWQGLFSSLPQAVQQAAGSFLGLNQAVQQLGGVTGATHQKMVELRSGLDGASTSAGKLKAEFAPLPQVQGVIQAVTVSVRGLGDQLTDSANDAKGLQTTGKAALTDIMGLANAARQPIVQLGDSLSGGANMAQLFGTKGKDAMAQVATATNSTNGTFQTFIKTIDTTGGDMRELGGTGTDSLGDIAQAGQQAGGTLNKSFTDFRNFMIGGGGVLPSIRDASNQYFGREIPNVIATLVTGGKVDFADMAKGWVFELTRVAADKVWGVISQNIGKLIDTGLEFASTIFGWGDAFKSTESKGTGFLSSVGSSLVSLGSKVAGFIGGLIFHEGGVVGEPDTGTRKPNEVRATLERGEFVVNRDATSQWRGVLESINNGSWQSFFDRPAGGLGDLVGAVMAPFGAQIGFGLSGAVAGVPGDVAKGQFGAQLGGAIAKFAGKYGMQALEAYTGATNLGRAESLVDSLATRTGGVARTIRDALGSYIGNSNFASRIGQALAGLAGGAIAGPMMATPAGGVIRATGGILGRQVNEILGKLTGNVLGTDPALAVEQALAAVVSKVPALDAEYVEKRAEALLRGHIWKIILDRGGSTGGAIFDAYASQANTVTEFLNSMEEKIGIPAGARSLAAEFAVKHREEYGWTSRDDWETLEDKSWWDNIWDAISDWWTDTGGDDGDTFGGGDGVDDWPGIDGDPGDDDLGDPDTGTDDGGTDDGGGLSGGDGSDWGGDDPGDDHLNSGGWVGDDAAGPDVDAVPAMLTKGEFVVRRKVAQRNRGLLERLNGGGFNLGTAAGFNLGGSVGDELIAPANGDADLVLQGRRGDLHFHGPVITNDLTFHQFTRRMRRAFELDERRRAGRP